MNLIEIRGQAKRHFLRRLDPKQNVADLVYQKCRAVMEFFVEQGINPERISGSYCTRRRRERRNRPCQ